MSNYTAQAVAEHLNNVESSRVNNNTHATFRYDGELDEAATTEAGRHIYKIIERVDIKVSGRPDPIPRVVQDQHKRDHQAAYNAFKSQEEKPEDGTLLKEWSLLPLNKMMELRDLGIRTVDELAVCDESMPHMEYYTKEIQMAKDWIEAASETKNKVPGLKKKLKEKEALIEKLQDQVTLLNRQLRGE